VSDQFSKDVAMDGVRGRGENLLLGILAGTFAALLGALIWMGVAVATGWRGGFVALAIGAMVGAAVRYVGNGTGMIFGVAGALLTLMGCLGGEVLAELQFSVTPQHDFYDVLSRADWGQLLTNIFARMDAIMYLIYAIGIFEGYKLSIRK
jgi:hypothetical protein